MKLVLGYRLMGNQVRWVGDGVYKVKWGALSKYQVSQVQSLQLLRISIEDHEARHKELLKCAYKLVGVFEARAVSNAQLLVFTGSGGLVYGQG